MNIVKQEINSPAILKRELLEDTDIAIWLNDIAQSATKTIASDWELSTSPDYNSRLKALDMILKLKGHYREEKKWNSLPEWIYIFTK